MKQVSLWISATAMTIMLSVSGAAAAEMANNNEDSKYSQQTVNYVFSASMMQTLGQLGAEQDRWFGLQLDCKAPYKITPIKLVVLTPLDIVEGLAHPTKGLWKIRYELERCGASKVYNATFIANPSGEPPTYRSYYPGSTLAGATLVADGLESAMLQVLIIPEFRHCKNNAVFDMRVTAPVHDVVDGAKILKNIWSELWTFRVCSKMVDVEISFIPDANGGGTTINTSPARLSNAKSDP